MNPRACAKATGSQMRSKIRSRSVRSGTCRRWSRERLAPDALHHVEEPAVGEPAGVVDRDDARVFEPGEDARLAAEPAFESRAGQRVGNLDRHLAPELVVDGEEDRSHAAAADLLDDRVAAGLELRPAPERPQPGDGRVRQPAR